MTDDREERLAESLLRLVPLVVVVSGSTLVLEREKYGDDNLFIPEDRGVTETMMPHPKN